MSSITGNLVAACAAYATTSGVIIRTSVSLAFAVAAGLSATVVLKLRLCEMLSKAYISIVLFSAEIILFVISWAVGAHLNTVIQRLQSLGNWQTMLVASLLGATMGIHNVAARETIPGTYSL